MSTSLICLVAVLSFVLGRVHTNWSRKRMIDRIMDEQDRHSWEEF